MSVLLIAEVTEGALARVEWKRRAREGSPPQVWTRFARGGVLDKA